MRLLAKGEPFMHVDCDFEVGVPTFSEAFLYPAVGKGDARFILAVAAEYEHLIKVLGTERVKELLATAVHVEDE